MAARHIDIIDAINDQDQLTVKVKKAHPNATIPTYAHASDAGLDLTAVALTRNSDGSITYHTGLALEIPTGYVGLVFPRSSLCNYDLRLTNCVGVIDSGYRGEITLRFKPTKIGRWLAKFPIFGRRFAPNIYNVGDRVGQLIVMPYPRVTLTLSDKLNTSDRGQNGYGSTGK
ncbi:MAG: dUTP diphosphatase [Fibrobacter sp.]|nr:dUTP diphosphatase [Fibrobacter sp.]